MQHSERIARHDKDDSRLSNCLFDGRPTVQTFHLEIGNNVFVNNNVAMIYHSGCDDDN